MRAEPNGSAATVTCAAISRALLGPPVEPATVLGEAALSDGGRLKVIAPATHDTASSVAAIPLEGDGEVFLGSGSWSLMGIESRIPLASDAARQRNVTNEGHVERRYRVLKNITGLWIIERIRKELGGRRGPRAGRSRARGGAVALADRSRPATDTGRARTKVLCA